MKIHEEALQEVTEFFKSRGRELTGVNRLQAELPVCCEKVTNAMGTAPGMWFERNGKVFVSMPGVPHEMKNMMSSIVIPRLQQTFRPPAIEHTVIRTIGIGESFLADKISSWERALPPHIKLAYLPSLGQVKLRLTAHGTDRSALREESHRIAEQLKPVVGEYIFGYGEEDLETVLGRTLKERELTVAVAESCTGGFVSHLFTSVPGSSRYFRGSIVAYDNDVKRSLLDVKEQTISEFGAVSEETIKEMANNVRLKLKTSIGIATSGIAGPDGGTADKPVGTVWIAYADNDKIVARKLQLSKDRIINIKMSSLAVLNLIRLNIPSGN
jgi:nicotinamide-nucleotide amidase